MALQQLARAYPHAPVAVLSDDRAQGRLLACCAQAAALGLRPGMRLSAALQLAPTLCARTVAAHELQPLVHALVAIAQRYSPLVYAPASLAPLTQAAAAPREAHAARPPMPAARAAFEEFAEAPLILWLGLEGLGSLFGTPRAWAQALLSEVRTLCTAHLVLGFRAHALPVLAAAAPAPPLILRSLAEEHARVGALPRQLLGLAPTVDRALDELGIATVAQFCQLPSAGLRQRFGAATLAIHTALRTLEPAPPPAACLAPPPIAAPSCELDPPVSATDTLIFLIKPLLDELLRRLAAQHRAVTQLELTLTLDTRPKQAHVEAIAPAEPTLSGASLLRLIQLALERITQGSPAARQEATPICGIRLNAQSQLATATQLAMFAAIPKREAAAANLALAKLRAEFGPHCVVRAELHDGHLPEQQYAWATLNQLPREALRAAAQATAPVTSSALAHPTTAEAANTNALRATPLIRRIHATPSELRTFPSAPTLRGPYRHTGHWWQAPHARDYYYAQLATGELYWLYFDQAQAAWFLQGEVQ